MNKGTVYNIMILSCGLGRVSNTNQTSSPSPSSDLFEDNNENTQLQENVENNNTDIDQ
jgi:hypothetical protein